MEDTKWTLEAFVLESGDPIEVENTFQENYQIAFGTDSAFYATSGNTCDGFYEYSTDGP
ncbi:hypothetical protein ACKGJO_06995 [Gracilimonas sp. Q87]|uniref:hypothetical protein n=1 Tax=Gracilimonas sp. Q87 TaxID=3384766 RepID=UPI003983FECD